MRRLTLRLIWVLCYPLLRQGTTFERTSMVFQAIRSIHFDVVFAEGRGCSHFNFCRQ